MAAFIGFIAFILAFFCVGALMEENLRKAVMFAAAFVVCSAIILASGTHGNRTFVQRDCWIDWDGFSNSEICD